ncbi:unnamed protein product [Lymnaea stagnalis]|uniref:Aquaporin n=1 Tax=Lymnaea stagnalis TaxID=6523 RepID=A0AAV2IL95_LYMST
MTHHHNHHPPQKAMTSQGSSDDLDELLWSNQDTVNSVSVINRVNYEQNDPFTIHKQRVEKRTSVREIFNEPVAPDHPAQKEPPLEKPAPQAPYINVKSLTIDMEKPTLLEKMTMTSDAGSIKWRRSRFSSLARRFACCLSFLNTEVDDITTISFWRACLAEFFGTFLLCFFAIGMSLHKKDTPAPPLLQGALGAGLFLGVIISSLANVSGGHINPAVTAGFAVVREISIARAICYVIFQCCGAVSGSMLLREITSDDMVGTLGVIAPPAGSLQALIVEMMISGFLVFVIFAHVDKGRTDVKGSVPLMIGLTIFVNVLVGAPSSGGCMNPARALGPAVVMGDFAHQWIYWLGPLTGGVFGALIYAYIFAVGASFKSLVKCCRPKDKTEYRSLLKKKPGNIVREKSHEANSKPKDTNEYRVLLNRDPESLTTVIEKAPETNV